MPFVHHPKVSLFVHLFFFFQAEDGIRDVAVTGVQTCALPIYGRWVFRHGTVPLESNRPVGSRLWLYTNFDCNLSCDYCCVRSSPSAPRRELGLARVKRIAREGAELRVKEIFVTGGEPFVLPDVGEILLACAAAAPTTEIGRASCRE